METIIVHQTDPAVLDVVTLILKQETFHVVPFGNCQTKVLTALHCVMPKLVILDYMIDGKKATHTLQSIKQSFKHLPVIAMSCNNNIEMLAPAKGFDGFIRQPFEIDQLVALVRHLIFGREGIKYPSIPRW